MGQKTYLWVCLWFLILQFFGSIFFCWISVVRFEYTIQVSENYCPYLWGKITYTHGVCTCNLFLKNKKDVMPIFRCKTPPTILSDDLHIFSSWTHSSHSLQWIKSKCEKHSQNIVWDLAITLAYTPSFGLKPKSGQHSQNIFHIFHIKLIYSMTWSMTKQHFMCRFFKKINIKFSIFFFCLVFTPYKKKPMLMKKFIHFHFSLTFSSSNVIHPWTSGKIHITKYYVPCVK
jgi:hypothetical protein